MAKKRKAVAAVTPSPAKPTKSEETPKLKIPKTELLEESREKEQKNKAIQAVEEPEEEEEEDEEEEVEEEEEEEQEEEEESSEEEDEETKRENLKKLLEPFSKDQIIEFIKEAALKDPSIVTRIATSAQSDPAHRKIFVYGLGWDATQDQLLATFKPFGEIDECKLVTDKTTGRAKGYAFLQYKTLKAAKKALKEPQKKVGSRVTTCQLASAGGVGSSSAPPEGRKLYVGNVGPQVNSEKLKSFFAKYGEIEEGPIGIDSNTGKFKGYAIFVFRTVEGFKKALEEPFKLFDGVHLQCRPANKTPPGGGAVVPPGSAAPQQSVAQGANFGLGGGVGAGAVQQSGVPSVNYGLGVNQGFNPLALMAQSQGLGLTNPLMGLSGNGFGPSMGYGLNSMTPGMMGSYNPHAAMQALGAYQSAQIGQTSAGATPVAGVGPPRPQPGLGSTGCAYTSFGLNR